MTTPRYDVFLSHNSLDKPQVEQIANRLFSEAKLQPFLDKWHLVPGDPWQPGLAEALERSATVAVFFGPSGNGLWHNEEMQVALMKAVREKKEFRVIPVVLPQADANSIPAFLQLRTWVDFKAGINSDIAFKRLVAGIRGLATEFEGLELPDEPAPFRGLMHFEAEHARFFFGREQDIGPTKDKPNLIDRLRTNRFVAVVGSSGSGKSSLVRAGLLPRLARDAIPGSRRWRIITFMPADDPWRSLAYALVSDMPASERGRKVADLLAQFDEPEAGLRHTLEAWFADTAEPLLLFVDQFEELFTHAPNARSTVAAREKYDERIARFVCQLGHEVLRPDGHFRSVITVRADFIPHCLRMPELKNLLQDRQLLLSELASDEAALREVIQRPAQEVGAMLETGLLEVLLADVRRQTGALPLLEHALSELWRKRRGPWLTLDAYKDTGGVSGALEQRAQETLQRLTEPQQRIARRIFVKLTSLEDDTEDTRRRVDRKALYAESADSAEIDAVIDVLAGRDARLIVADADALSIAHETLIQNWPRLRTWLKEDRELERIHRALERGANDWDAHARSKRYLFHATSAKLAETEEHATALADRITFMEREFLTACRLERNAETRRLRRRVHIAAAITCFAVVMLVLAVWQWRTAVRAQESMEGALVGSFFRTIGVATEATPSPDERAALWDLAELDTANARVREKVIDQWFQTEESIDRGLKHDARGLRAAGGIDGAFRQHIALRAKELADRLAEALENPQETDAGRLADIGSALAALAARMDPKDASSLAASVAHALENPQETDADPRWRRWRLLNALAALAARMDPKDAASVADSLAKALENPRETDSYLLQRLGSALAALAARMDSKDAASVADCLPAALENSLATALKNPQDSDADRLSSLAIALAALAARMDPKDAASIAARGEQALAEALENLYGNDPLRLSLLRIGMVALAARMDPKDAARAAERLAKALENLHESDEYRLSNLGSVLAALAARMDPEDAARAAERLAEALENPQYSPPDRLSNLAIALAALAARMDPKDAASMAARGAQALAKASENPQDIPPKPLSHLRSSLAPLAARMDPKDAASMADRLATTLAKPQEADFNSSLQIALTAMAYRMDHKDVARVADRLAEILEDRQLTDPDRLSSIGRALAALAARMAPKDAASVAARGARALADALENPQVTDPGRLSYCLSCLANSLAALAARMDPKDAACLAERLAKALENLHEPDAYRLSNLGSALAALAARMDTEDAARVAACGAQVLAKARAQKTDSSRLEDLGSALAARMDPKDAASMAEVLAKALENPQETDAGRLSLHGQALGGVSEVIPTARETRLFALYNVLLAEIPGSPEEGKEEYEVRKRIAGLCALLSVEDLAKVLKWPFCVGEAEKLVLAELEEKTGRKFDGDVWKFVAQAKSLGIRNLDAPAKRPLVKDALDELAALRREAPKSH